LLEALPQGHIPGSPFELERLRCGAGCVQGFSPLQN